MEKLSLAVVGSLAVASAFQPSSSFLLQHPSLSSRSSPVARKAGSISMDLPPLQRKRVVITGVGAVSPLGWGDDFWNGLIEGRSGIVRLPSWADDYPARIGGLVPDTFKPSDYMNAKEVKRQQGT
ncbi:hypothetical protein NSK_008471 [Nannochloropsis salina CCMP1776]|uniref:Beta-ketoacyl synthase-like N-terminal domain-containing protein n=1 Tax=Nannochloropsis salina CCMP1776 TaxID=1027361 RepID=A0A4D9CRH5_9STRA|nr:hypothetical protein NSK_008471 [Nannochloropsis salina CCMP1776]|eukprot:TFJ80185.1 hypothetical protein NSK_008471 [Nannochloropsis salina CCMP1776]